MDKPEPRTQQDRRSDSDRRMIESAIELFASRGYTKTTLVQIGEAAGCTGTLISNRFGSKEGLLRAVLAHILTRLSDDQARTGESSSTSANTANPADKTASAESSLRAFVNAYLQDVVKRQTRVRALHVIMGEALGALPEIQAEVANVNDVFRANIARLVATGIASGEYRPDIVPKDAAIIIVGVLRGVTTQALADSKAVKLKALIPAIQDSILAGLLRTNHD